MQAPHRFGVHALQSFESFESFEPAAASAVEVRERRVWRGFVGGLQERGAAGREERHADLVAELLERKPRHRAVDGAIRRSARHVVVAHREVLGRLHVDGEAVVGGRVGDGHMHGEVHVDADELTTVLAVGVSRAGRIDRVLDVDGRDGRWEVGGAAAMLQVHHVVREYCSEAALEDLRDGGLAALHPFGGEVRSDGRDAAALAGQLGIQRREALAARRRETHLHRR